MASGGNGNGIDIPAPSDEIMLRNKSSHVKQSVSTPPPGFVSSEPFDAAPNNSSLQKYLWSETIDGVSATDSNVPTGHAQQQQHSESQFPRTRNEMTSSFKNIAAALGNGLAESMEDATRGDHHLNQNQPRDYGGINQSHNNHGNSKINLTDNFFIPNKNNDNMNYERHKRHAASRLLGVPGAPSSSPTNHAASEAGSLFRGLDAVNPHDQSIANAGRNVGEYNGDDSKKNITNNNDSPATASFSRDSSAVAFHPSYGSKITDPSSKFTEKNNQKYTEQRNSQLKARLPVTKDLGCTVTEPSDSSYAVGRLAVSHNPSVVGTNQGRTMQNVNTTTYDIQSGMKHVNLWSESDGTGTKALNVKPSSSKNHPVDSINKYSPVEESRGFETASPSVDVETELRPFTWDTNHHEPSRTIVIIMNASIPSNEVGSLCESFGAIETFRSEFLNRIGVVFVSYFDMRCAQFAAMQLSARLQRMTAGSGVIRVKFCAPLNSSSQNDESMIVINDLPHQIGVENLGSMLSSFGAIRSLKDVGGNYSESSFMAEFHDVQDAKQVVLELESSQPWGSDVSVEVGVRNSSDRKKGRELLALLGRWRNQGGAAQSNQGDRHPVHPVSTADMYRSNADSKGVATRERGYERGIVHKELSQPKHSSSPGPPDGRYPYNNAYIPHHTAYSQYRGSSYHSNERVVNRGHGTYVNRQMSHQSTSHQHQHQHQKYYPQSHQINHGNFSGANSVVSGGSSRHTGGYYADDRSTGSRHTSASGYYTDDRSIGSHQSNVRSVNSLGDSIAGSRDGQNQHLMLDLDIVENGLDNRTSLMVRNIPNKYTQQMLLSEFTENDHGPGVIDFFYLPIDFKNRCNRGYAFINFVDYPDIVKFHRQYFGKHWRTFNSDKICDITYARIQGKAAMLKRFENSALMEKDEEYKPLVFVSNGPDKGERLPFPNLSRVA